MLILLSGEVHCIRCFIIIDYEYCQSRNEDDLHGESIKRPSNDKLSSIKLTLEEYEEINFLEDDSDDSASYIPVTEENDPDNPEDPDNPKDPEDNLEDTEDEDDYWNHNYDKYNLW